MRKHFFLTFSNLAHLRAHAASVRGAIARAAIVCLGLLARAVMVAIGLVALLLIHVVGGARMRTRELSLQLINLPLLLLAEGVLAGIVRSNFMFWIDAF